MRNRRIQLFETLRTIRAFERQRLDFLGTLEDHHLVGEIGYHHAAGRPLTLKQLSLLEVGSIATVQRRLRRLKELGLVQHRRAAADRRSVELTLTPKCLRVYSKYGALMRSRPPVRESATGSRMPRHVCGLCNGDAGGRRLLAYFLAQGLKRGDKCVLMAPPGVQAEILARSNLRQQAAGGLVVSEGHDSADAQFAFLNGVSQEARRAGQNMCLAADMQWALARNWRFDAILDAEKQFDALAQRTPLTGLCVYDTRRFSSGEFLRAVKCHRDHARHPVMLG